MGPSSELGKLKLGLSDKKDKNGMTWGQKEDAKLRAQKNQLREETYRVKKAEKEEKRNQERLRKQQDKKMDDERKNGTKD